MKISWLIAALSWGISCTTVSAGPVVFSFTGDLRTDANVTGCGEGCTLGGANSDGDYAQYAAAVDGFHAGSVSTLTALSFSYGGGTNGAGALIPQGGFEPYLSLFDASGNFIQSTFFGITCPSGANINTASGLCYDVRLDGGILEPGDYRIVISAFENLSLAENLAIGTLADGFTGLGNLYPGEDLHYAFDVILDASPAPVPEPQSVYLFVTAGLAAYVFRKRSAKSSAKEMH